MCYKLREESMWRFLAGRVEYIVGKVVGGISSCAADLVEYKC